MSSKEELVSDYTRLIIESVDKARVGVSKLNNADIVPGGWCNVWKGVNTMNASSYLHLINNLCSYPDIRCLNIGFFQGGTLFPCFEGGNTPEIVAIDNFFDQPVGDSEFFSAFEANSQRLGYEGRFKLIREDFHHLDVSKIDLKVNFHIYDADHEEESQFLGVAKFDPLFDDVFILLVDDFSSPNPRNGTYRAIETMKYIVHHASILEGDPWHCGQGLFVLEKNK